MEISNGTGDGDFSVSRIEPGGQADRDGRLCCGDGFLNAAGRRLRGLPPAEAAGLLRAVDGQLELVLCRRPASPPPSPDQRYVTVVSTCGDLVVDGGSGWSPGEPAGRRASPGQRARTLGAGYRRWQRQQRDSDSGGRRQAAKAVPPPQTDCGDTAVQDPAPPPAAAAAAAGCARCRAGRARCSSACAPLSSRGAAAGRASGSAWSVAPTRRAAT